MYKPHTHLLNTITLIVLCAASSNDNIIMFSQQIDDDYIIPLSAERESR